MISWRDPRLRRWHSFLLSSGLLLGLWLPSSLAQVSTAITSDGTLGTTVTQSGPIHTITGGTRPGNGPNLFHSFDRFSVGTGATASFTSAQTGIKHILSRVTGGQRSDLDGQLRTDGQLRAEGAHLYLLNPSGVMFGPNASLDVRGSFHVSTADYLHLADGARFFARLGENSILSVAPPVAFGFMGPTPAAITVQGSLLTVSEGKAMSVVGGEIQVVGGQLVAPSGRVQLASVASSGEVLASPLEMEPDLQVNAFTRLGSLTLEQNALLNVSGTRGGTVLIRSGRLLVDQSSILADTLGTANGARKGIDIAVTEDMTHRQGGFITAASVGGGDAGNIQLTARSLHVDGALIGAGTFSAGRAGDIRIDVGTLLLTNGAVIDSSTFSLGHGGTVRVSATETMTLTGSGIFANAEGREEGAGAAGSIVVDAGHVSLTEGGQIGSSTRGPGPGGSVTVTASDTITLAGTSPDGFGSGLFSVSEGQGDAGQLTLKALAVHLADGGIIGAPSFGGGRVGAIVLEVGTLTLTGGARITNSSFGSGGRVHIAAREALTITGHDQAGVPSGLFFDTFGVGDAGAITIVTRTLQMDGGAITASTSSGGDPASIFVAAETMTLTGGAQIVGSNLGSSRGRGGSVTLTARDAITITGHDQAGVPSGLSFDTFGTGDASRILITTPTLQVDGGTITASTSSGGDAGRIDLTARTMTLTGGAQIVGRSSGSGSGGMVNLAAMEALTITGQSQTGVPSGLSFDTSDVGSAGMIRIAAPTLQVAGGTITASTSSLGNAGTLMLEAARMTLTGGAQIVGRSSGGGSGGTVHLAATEAIRITGQDHAGVPSGLSFDTSGMGNAGTITIIAPTLQVAGGAITVSTTGAGSGGALRVAVETLTLTGGAQLSSSTAGVGGGGAITVQGLGGVGSLADVIAISGPGSGLFTSAEGRGSGGDMTLQARTIELTQGARLTAASIGAGNAGGITLTVGDTLLLRGHSVVTTEASQATGGNIRVTASAQVRLQDSQISATVRGGAGDGGNVTIDPEFILLQGSQITANAVVGNGGRISLTASKALLADPSSAVTASSTLGLNGQVNIQAPVTNITGTVAPLPQAFAPATELLQSRCAERLREGRISRLVIGGRDGVPLEPGSLLLSPLERMDQTGVVARGEQERQSPEAQQEWVVQAQAQARGEWEVECARWVGKPETTARPKRSR